MKPTIRLLCLAVAATILCPPTPVAAQRPFDDLIVFGDSYSDNGNLFLLSKGLVYPPPYSEGQASNGPLWVDRLWERLHLGGPQRDPKPAPHLLGGNNYAYGGSRTGDGFNTTACSVIDGTLTCIPNIGLTIEYFFAEGKTLNGRELIVINGGGANRSPVQGAHYLGDHIATLAAAGGKAFLVPNLPSFTTTPGVDPHLVNSLDAFVATYNTALAKELDALEARFDITIYRSDWFALEAAVISDPAAYGLSNVTDAACPDCGIGIPAPGAADTVVPNPDQYLFWDPVGHYAATFQRISGDAAADLVLDR